MRMLGFTTGLALLCVPVTTMAYPVHSRLYQARYGEAARCALCHVGSGGTQRNDYGRDFRARGETAQSFAQIEGLDSDRDGFSNLAEIEGGSNPGNKASVPGRPGRIWKRAKTPAPTEQLELVFGRASRIDKYDARLTDAQVATVESAIGGSLDTLDRMPTVYFQVEGERKVGAALFSHFSLADGAYSLLVGVGKSGAVSRIAMFRAGADDGSAYSAYLRCLRGRARNDIPEPGERGCPAVAGQARAGREIARSVRKVLWTLTALFSKR